MDIGNLYILNLLSQDFQLAFGKKRGLLLFPFFLLIYILFQSMGGILYVLFYHTSVVKTTVTTCGHITEMVVHPFFTSFFFSYLFIAFQFVEWSLIAILIYVELVSFLKGNFVSAIFIIFLIILGVFINIPYTKVYQQGLWKIQYNQTALHLDYLLLMKRINYEVPLDHVTKICVYDRNTWYRDHVLTAYFYYDGEIKRTVVRGVLFGGFVNKHIKRFQEHLLAKLQVISSEKGIMFHHQTTPCKDTTSMMDSTKEKKTAKPVGVAEEKVQFTVYRYPHVQALIAVIVFITTLTHLRSLLRTYPESIAGIFKAGFRASLRGLLRPLVFYLPFAVLVEVLIAKISGWSVSEPSFINSLKLTVLISLADNFAEAWSHKPKPDAFRFFLACPIALLISYGLVLTLATVLTRFIAGRLGNVPFSERMGLELISIPSLLPGLLQNLAALCVLLCLITLTSYLLTNLRRIHLEKVLYKWKK